MMRRTVAVSLSLALIVFAFGCASMQKAISLNGLNLTAEEKANVAHYNGQNWGLYLLSIPLITGDTGKISEISEQGVSINTVLFKDTVDVPSVTDMVTRVAKNEGSTTVEDMVSSRKNVWIVPTLIFFIRTVEVSGNGVK